MQLRSSPLIVVCLVLCACGGRSHRDQMPCQPGEVRANPDGRGMRCVDSASECFEPDACESVDPCCTGTCADPDRDGLWTCALDCLPLECTPETDCGPGNRCEVYDECRAQCVPDAECPPGQVVADPDGNGYRCVSVDSECFFPDDCPRSEDPCCESVCSEDGTGRYACALDCIPQYFRDGEDADPAPVCYADDDCAFYGPGWVCDGCPGLCIWKPECASADDCVIGIRTNECCACPEAYSRAEMEADPCLVAPGEDPPDGCAVLCPTDVCGGCFEPVSAECSDYECVAVY